MTRMYDAHDIAVHGEYIHFAPKSAIESIMTSNALYGKTTRARHGISTVDMGHGRSWNDFEWLGPADSIEFYSVEIAKKAQNWYCLPKNLMQHPENFVAIWFLADETSIDHSDQECSAEGTLRFLETLLISVDEAFALMGTTLSAAIASRNV